MSGGCLEGRGRLELEVALSGVPLRVEQHHLVPTRPPLTYDRAQHAPDG